MPSDLGDKALRACMRALSSSGPTARLSIAIFHRVLPVADPLFPDELDRARFDEVCRWLAAWFRVLPLDAAVEGLRRGTLPPRALAITFDDGYADNHDIALPVLQAHGLQATFFIATGYLDGGRMWNDTLIEAVRACRSPRLDLQGLGLPVGAGLAVDTPPARRAAIDALLSTTKYLPPPQRQAMVERIAERAGAELPDALMMTSGQIRAMAAAGMQIGAHTVSHPILAGLDDAAALTEMVRSKTRLEELVSSPVRLFAYPNGRPGRDYLPRDVGLARQAGFEAAVSTAPGAARVGDDLFQLPRFTPWDRGRLAFGARMARNLIAARLGR